MSTTDRAPPTDIDPEHLLPDHSVLSLTEYLAMQEAIGNETRFRLLYALKQRGEMSATELGEALDLSPNNLHYHLNKLVDVGLVHNRKEKTPDSDGLFSYYVASGLGEAILEDGVEALMQLEWTIQDVYSS